MPLIQSKSKKALQENIEAEMSSGKPQAQSIAIAYDVKRRNSKKKRMKDGGILEKIGDTYKKVIDTTSKYHNAPDRQPYPDAKPPPKKEDPDPRKRPPKQIFAKGGYVNDSAKTEQRPMPDERDQDAKMVSRNSGKKAPGEDSWSDDPTVRQAQKLSITKLSQPKIVGSDAFSVRRRDQREENNNQMEAFPPETDRAQPQQSYDEVGAQDTGSDVSDMEDQHNNGRPPYNMAIEHEYAQDIAKANMKKEQSYAMGGVVAGQPEEEADMEHEDSVAAAIMARRDKMKSMHSDSDEDRMVMMARGGEIHSHDSIYSDDSSQADLSRNADEDANEEDQLSFNALRKENYSESEGLEQLDSPMDSNEQDDDIESDKHDMVSQIRSKMNKQRQFKVR